MFVSKLKNAVALMTVAFVLTAGAGAWRYAVVAGQSEERRQERPAPKANAAQAPKIYPHPVPDAAVPEAAAPHVADAPPMPLPPAAPASRMFQIDLQVHGLRKDGTRKLLADPKFQTLEGQPVMFAHGNTRTLQLGGGKTEQMLIGTSIRVTARSGKGDNVRLDVSVTRPTRLFDDCTWLETKTVRHVIGTTLGSQVSFAVGGTDSKYIVGDSSAQASVESKVDDYNTMELAISVGVQEVKPDTGGKKIAEAERYLQMAEFWRRTGHLSSALLYYQILSNEYPGTIYAERAKERTSELEEQLLSRTELSEADFFFKARLVESKRQEEKPLKKLTPARIWRVFILGNKKISDEAILKRANLYPGQILSDSDPRAAEINLSRLKGLKSNPKVTVIEHEDNFNDIRITVEEK